MMVNYDMKEHGEAAALARATQGWHTNSYAQVVLQILPKEDVSTIIQESTTLNGHSYFEKLGSILAQHKSELHSLCKIEDTRSNIIRSYIRFLLFPNQEFNHWFYPSGNATAG